MQKAVSEAHRLLTLEKTDIIFQFPDFTNEKLEIQRYCGICSDFYD